MSEIKERDILKLLRGEASVKKLKALEEWASSNSDHATDLEYFQKIYDESTHLSTYTPVDADHEWKNFTNILQNSVNEGDLLSYFDGLATPAQRNKVEEWRSFSSTNKKEFNLFNVVITESANLNDITKVDANAEWDSFNKMINSTATSDVTPVVSPSTNSFTPQAPSPSFSSPSVSSKNVSKTVSTPSMKHTATTQSGGNITLTPNSRVEEEKQQKGRRIFMIRSMAAAAAVFLVAFVGWNIYQGNQNSLNTGDLDSYSTFATTDLPKQITISDGSVIHLGKYSTLTYFSNIDDIDQRNVMIDGQAEFDVVSMPDKPFVVTSSKSSIGIRVLGTHFKLSGNEEEEGFDEVIDNFEGSVKAYSLNDTSNFVVLTEGDRFGFDGVSFIDLVDEEEDYYGKDYDILFVLDYLMKESEWKVTSGSEIEFDAEGIVNIDLEKPYEEILIDLQERANFEFTPRDCEGCYEVRKFLAN